MTKLSRIIRQATGKDFPLSADPATRMLPWIVGAMVYVMAIALMGIWALSQTASGWTNDLTRTATIQVSAPTDMPPTELNRKLDNIAKLARLHQGVQAVSRVGDDVVRDSLRPFLGDTTPLSDLPLPVLFDVQLEQGAVLDAPALTQHLSAILPNVMVDTHSTWQERLISIVGGLQVIAWAVVLAVFLTTLSVVIFATKAMMQSHRMIIRTLHLIGATDTYIALQFQVHALKIGLVGTVGGFVCAGATLYGMNQMSWFALDAMMGQFPPLSFGADTVAMMGILGVFICALIARSAGRTVHTALADMFNNK